MFSRREFIAASAAAGTALIIPPAFAAPEKRFEGIFPILQTPFTDTGGLDSATLEREVEFVHRIGVQGMAWPQLASEYPSLTPDERMAGAEAIVRAAKGLDSATRPAVIIGVQAPDSESAVRYARHAAKIGADGVIAIPLNGGKNDDLQMEYYKAIGAASTLPLFVQTIGPMSVDLVLRMAGQIPTLRYVKDEAGVTLPRLTDYRKRGQILKAVFTGAHGKTFLDELARGAVGNMPAAGFADLYVSAQTAWKQGRQDEAMATFGVAELLIQDAIAYGVPGQKYILQLRGVFPNTKCREQKESVVFDDEAREAIRRTVKYAQKWFKA